MVEFTDGLGILPYRKLFKPSMRLEFFQNDLIKSFSTQYARNGTSERHCDLPVFGLVVCGNFMKGLSVKYSGMSAFNFFEPSLSTHCITSIFPEAEVQRPKSPASRGLNN